MDEWLKSPNSTHLVVEVLAVADDIATVEAHEPGAARIELRTAPVPSV